MATNGMTINGLNPLSALTADDKIPVWDTGASGEPTKEITAQNMANSVKSLASLPNTAEMNNAIAQSTATTYEQLSASSLGINGEGSIKTFKYGKIIILIFNLAFTTDLPYGQAAFTLPDNLKPYVGFTFNLTTQNSTYSGGYFEIATNGDVICYGSPSTNIYLGGCITYLAA